MSTVNLIGLLVAAAIVLWGIGAAVVYCIDAIRRRIVLWRDGRRQRCRNCFCLIPAEGGKPTVCCHLTGAIIDLDGPAWMRCRWFERRK